MIFKWFADAQPFKYRGSSLLFILKKYRCIIYHLITISIRDISFKLFRSLAAHIAKTFLYSLALELEFMILSLTCSDTAAAAFYLQMNWAGFDVFWFVR